MKGAIVIENLNTHNFYYAEFRGEAQSYVGIIIIKFILSYSPIHLFTNSPIYEFTY